MNTTLGIYCRVSTDEQASHGLSLKDQERQGITLANLHGFSYEIFIDDGVSGTKAISERPSLKRLVERITDSKIQAVFVTRLDRLSRMDPLSNQIMFAVFKDNGIRLFEGDNEINFTDLSQGLLTGIKLLLSEYESAVTSKRIKTTLLEGVLQGRVNGGPVLTYGYKKGENKQMVINEDEAKIVRMIFEMSLKGMGTKVIANKLNELKIPTKRGTSDKGYMKVRGVTKTKFVWRDAVVYRILNNTVYKGQRLYREKVYPAPVIVEETIFDMVSDKLKNKQNFVETKNTWTYLLKGLMYCTKCGGRMYGRKREDLSDNAYICTSQRYKGEFCGNKGINIDFIEELVLSNLLTLDKQVETFYNRIEKEGDYYKKKMKHVELHRNKIKESIKSRDNLLDTAEKAGIDPKLFKDRFSKLTKEIETHTELELQFIKDLGIFNEKEDVLSFIKSTIKSYKKNQDLQSKSNFIRSFISSIYVLWNEKTLSHYVAINYKIDKLAQYQLSKELNVNRTGVSSDKSKKIKIISEEIKINNTMNTMDESYLTTNVNYGKKSASKK